MITVKHGVASTISSQPPLGGVAFTLLNSTLLQQGSRLQAAWLALQQRRFFKLIIGASFTQATLAGRLASVYAQAGATCIDLAADPVVLHAVLNALAALPKELPLPLLMLSLDVDGDPHFNKVAVEETACIACDACVPVCPTQALQLNEAASMLLVEDSLCYGCNRCVPVCPTQALSLHPLPQLPQLLEACLSHPAVEALELHATTLNAEQLSLVFERLGGLLHGKLVSLCFRVPAVPELEKQEAVRLYLQAFQQLCQQAGVFGSLLQVDGLPMAGSEQEKTLSLPALNSAAWLQNTVFKPNVYENSREATEVAPLPITVSGGINAYTAEWLLQAPYTFISGAGLGTVARQAVWPYIQGQEPDLKQALKAAKGLLESFIKRY
jgi:Fe-S-cluster-containing hydrogenase component 2